MSAKKRALADARAEQKKLASWQTKTEAKAKLEGDLIDPTAKLRDLGSVPKHASKTIEQWASYLAPFGATYEGVEKWQPLVRSVVIETINRIAPGWIFLLLWGCVMKLAQAQTKDEPASEPVHEPAQKPEPSPKPRTRAPKAKPVQSGIVLGMEDRAKVVRAERFKGMSEQKIANTLGWHKSMVHRALNYREPAHRGSAHAGSVRGSVHPAHGSVQAIA